MRKLFATALLLLSVGYTPNTWASSQPLVRCEEVYAPKQRFVSLGFNVKPDGFPQIKMTDDPTVVGKTLNFIVRNLLYFPVQVGELKKVLNRFMNDHRNEPFWVKLPDAFQFKIEVENSQNLNNIPLTGGGFVTLNHPLHAKETMAAAKIISQRRPDVKVVLTQFLNGIPDMTENAFLVNANGGPTAKLQNAPIKEAMYNWVKDGHIIIIMPSGTVSLKENLSDSYARDPVWRTSVMQIISRLASEGQETFVTNIFADGQPTQAYQVAAQIPNLLPRTVLHVRALGKGVGSKVSLVIGQTLKGSQLLAMGDQQKAMDFLRAATYLLKPPTITPKKSTDRVMKQIVPASDLGLVKNELDSKAQKIFEFYPDRQDKGIEVFMGTGSEIPLTLYETGRLSEKTFRENGEGTGQEIDQDKYDSYYKKLVAWIKKTSEISGSYRVGVVREILAKYGPSGLYTRLFFNFDQLLQGDLGKYSLEMGRSFVVTQFQKKSLTLPALFGGIGSFLSENPKFRYLFGPVSLSGDYKEASKFLIHQYLLRNFKYEHSDQVRATNPPTFNVILTPAEVDTLLEPIKSIKDLDDMIKAIEGDPRKGLPDLFKIYIDLGARFAAADVDNDFNTLDFFIVVDLLKTPTEKLKQYMGEKEAPKFVEDLTNYIRNDKADSQALSEHRI